VITEKIHGVQCQMGLYHGEPFVASKIYAAHGQVLIIGDVNSDNIYVQAALRHMEDLRALAEMDNGPGETFQLLGEIHGPGVQDLRYDSEEKRFAAFDLHAGEPDRGRFLDHSDMEKLLDGRIMCVPHLHRGPYSREKLDSLTAGKSAIASHHREGVVVKTAEEREDIRLGRVILKSVSDRHLLRKGDATEFE
jgi:RNA ligase (TIGR02306 family)